MATKTRKDITIPSDNLNLLRKSYGDKVIDGYLNKALSNIIFNYYAKN